MAVIDWNGKPLPDGHPFKGTQIIFGQKRPDLSAKPSAGVASAADPDPMRPMADAMEQALQTLMATGTYPGAPSKHLPNPMAPAMVGAERVLQELIAETGKNTPSK